MSDTPLQPGPNYFSDNPYQPPGGGGESPPRRGLMGHIRWVAIANSVQGMLELCVAAFCILTGSMAIVMRDAFVQQAIRQGDPNPEAMPTFIAGIYLGMGIPLLLIGILRLIAGSRNYLYLSRTFGIVSLCLGLISTFTGCCSLTAIGVSVYGLIVLFNREATEAFEMRAAGAPVDEVHAAFNTRLP